MKMRQHKRRKPRRMGHLNYWWPIGSSRFRIRFGVVPMLGRYESFRFVESPML